MNSRKKLSFLFLCTFVLFLMNSCGGSSTFEFIALLCGGYATDSSEFVAVGESGTSLYTSDGGNLYTLQDVPRKNDLTDYTVQNGIHYAIGKDSTFLTRLSIQGEYNIIDTGIKADYYDIEFADSDVAYIAASNSLVLKSVDSGLNWTSYSLSTDMIKFSSIDCIDRARCLVAGESGSLYKTNDGFETYTKLDVGLSIDFNKIVYKDSTSAWLVGDDGYAGSTGDGGLSWNQIETGTLQPLLGITFNADYSKSLLYGQSYAAYSTDGGWTFMPSTFPEADEEFIQSIIMFKLFLIFGQNPFSGVLLGNRGRAFFTYDNGATFTSQTIHVGSASGGGDSSGSGGDFIDSSGSGEEMMITPTPTPVDEESVLEFTLSDQDFSFSHSVGQTSCPQKVGQFVVTNTGNTTTAYSVNTSGNQLSTMPSTFNLEPGGTQTVMIFFTCSQSSSFSGTVSVKGTDSTSGASTSVNAQVSGNVG